MYKLLLALALTTANKEDAKPSGGLRGLRFASYVNTDKGGPEASACLKAGGDCSECCGGCNPKEITDGEDFTGEDECVCFHGAFDTDEDIKLSNHDDCATVARKGNAQISIRGEDGVDAIHMDSSEFDGDYSENPGIVYGNDGTDHLTCLGDGHWVYGGDYLGYQADGGNFLSCSGDDNNMRGSADCDDITCKGKFCNVNGHAGNDLLKVDYDYVDTPDFQGENVMDLTGGAGIDKCVYNGEDAYYEEYVPGYFTCEPWAEFPDPAC